MNLSASDLYRLHQPSQCDLRVHLDAGEIKHSEPGPFEALLIVLGQRHERSHLSSLGEVVTIPEGTAEQRVASTLKAIGEGAPVIYQPYFRIERDLAGRSCEITGIPDFLIQNDDGYIIRDVKLSKRISEKEHPEIILQLGLYGFLYENVTESLPVGLEVFSGNLEIVSLEYDGGVGALEVLEQIALLKQESSAPTNAVGWSKCSGCGYRHHCWPAAEQRRDVALVPEVFQQLALTLNAAGIYSFDDLAEQHNEASLSDIKFPWGNTQRRVGKTADKIMPLARALMSNSEILLQPPDIPVHANYVMFDLEGLPPHLDQLQKIYMWGMQVFGERPSEYKPALAGFGPDGDRQGWAEFLEIAGRILDDYGDVPFVHWHHYEKTNINEYVNRYGDIDGVADRVLSNLLDLLPITNKAVALPVHSYSLKVIERYVGFERQQDEFGGEWSIAKYIEATETEDASLRDEVMNSILDYNREDLEATWAVMTWLLSKQ